MEIAGKDTVGYFRNRGSESSSADLDRLEERQRRISQALDVLRRREASLGGLGEADFFSCSPYYVY